MPLARNDVVLYKEPVVLLLAMQHTTSFNCSPLYSDFVLRPTTQVAFLRLSAAHYVDNAKRFKNDLREIPV